MSRSKRRTPVCGMTSARSEKQDKRLYNRRYRRACKQVIHADPGRVLGETADGGAEEVQPGVRVVRAGAEALGPRSQSANQRGGGWRAAG
jgi:hypothetical protein